MRGAMLVVLAMCVAASGAGQTPALSARASVDSSTYLVGDWITVHVDLHHPKGTTLRPVVKDTVNGFSVIQRGPLVPSSDTTTTTGFVIARYDSGQAVFPPLEFSVTVPGDTSVRSIATNPVVLTVRTVQVDTTRDFRDLKPPMSIPVSLAELLLYALIGLVVGVALYLAYRFWKKKKSAGKDGAGMYIPPARPAHVIALEQLAILKEKKLWQRGLIKQYYSEATEIFRRYLENRYSMQAMEETTGEIMAGLRRLRFPDPMLASSERVLRRADLVKFAKFQPGIADHEEMISVIFDIVDRTKIVSMSPASQEETKAVAHAGN